MAPNDHALVLGRPPNTMRAQGDSMQLILTAVALRDAPLETPLAAVFGPQGGTIGRAPDNDLVLEDPQRIVSRFHGRVSFKDGVFYFSSAGGNPSVFNGHMLENQGEVPISSGDRITIGDYRLEARLRSDPAEATASRPDVPVFTPPTKAAPLPLPGFNQVRENRASAPGNAPVKDNRIRNFQAAPGFGSRSAAEFSAVMALADPLATADILDAGSLGNTIDHHSDPLGLNLFDEQASRQITPPIFQGEAPSLQSAQGSLSDHVAPQSVPLAQYRRRAASPMAIPLDFDFLADAGAQRPGSIVGTPATARRACSDGAPSAPASANALPPATGPANTGHLPAQGLLHESDSQDEIRQTLDYARPGPAAPQPVALEPDADALLKALARGLGLPAIDSGRNPAALCFMIGAMLREATAGTMNLLFARSRMQQENRIDVPADSLQQANPLQSFEDVDAALKAMLGMPAQGYLSSVRAMQHAFTGLKSHELSILAGMQAALSAVVGHFEPAAIEAGSGQAGVMDRVLPVQRKAALWDQLIERHALIRKNEDNHFHRLCSDTFARAYLDQAVRLQQGRPTVVADAGRSQMQSESKRNQDVVE
jgi:type VI secretion system FHA domain protein